MATIVKKGPDESEDRLIARFRKKILNAGVLNELKERQFYKPPSVEKKERLSSLKRRRKRRRW